MLHSLESSRTKLSFPFNIAFFYWGSLSILIGLAMYLTAVPVGIISLIGRLHNPWIDYYHTLMKWSTVPVCIGIVLIALDLGLMLPKKRRTHRLVEGSPLPIDGVTVALTAYNDEKSIAEAVSDFRAHPLVRRVIVVSNNSKDRTMERAAEAGAIVFNELKPGYGRCVYRCFSEALRFTDTDYIVLCEGDRTFRARDIDKLVAYLPHAEIVNGTRIVEQLRDYTTQLSTFMYYGNFFVGKLLEVKHLGRGTFTDVGTTYKAVRRASLLRLMPLLNPAVNLEFNAHFLDVALQNGFLMVECPITFHPRVGVSKGGNVNNMRAVSVGLRMIRGLTIGWSGRDAMSETSDAA